MKKRRWIFVCEEGLKLEED
ncbi:hypothetical protein A2U01_0098647, partial [Trifolium medium]|nr:hypothetical protein [Trifolium medium]